MRQGLFLVVFGLVLGTALSPGRSDGPPVPQRPPAGKSPSAAKGWLEKAESGYYVQIPALAESLDENTTGVLQATPTGPQLIPAGPIWSEASPAAPRIKLPIRLADHYGPVPQTTRANTSENKTAEWSEPVEGSIRGAGQSIRLSFDNSAGFGISVGTAEAKETACPVSSCCCQDLLPVWMQPLLACFNGPCESTCANSGCHSTCALNSITNTIAAAKECRCTSTCKCGDMCICKEGVRCSITCTCKACNCNVNCQCGTGCKCTSTKRCSARCLCSGNSLATDYAKSVCIDEQGNVSCCIDGKCDIAKCSQSCNCTSGDCAVGKCYQADTSLPSIGKFCHAETKNGNYFGQLQCFTSTWVVLQEPHNQSRQFIPTASLQCLTEMDDSPELSPSGDESSSSPNEVVATPLPSRATCVPLALPIEAGQSVSPVSASCFLKDEAPSVTIPRGMRLYSVNVAEYSVALIAPGDRVDLLLLTLPQPGPGAPPCLSRVFAENVKVVGFTDSGCTEAVTVLLLVSKDQCELIALANAIGMVTLCKRSPEDATDISTESSADNRQAATVEKLLGISDQPGPDNCAVPVFGVSPWGPMVRPPVANWGPMPQGPEGFAQPGYPGGLYFPGGTPSFGPGCPLPSGGPYQPSYGAPPYSDPTMEAAVPPPSLNGPSPAMPTGPWPSPTFAAPTHPSTASVPPTPFPSAPRTTPGYPPVTTSVPSSPKGDLAPSFAPTPSTNSYIPSEASSLSPTEAPKSSSKLPSAPSTMPTQIKATGIIAPKSAQLPPPSGSSPMACQVLAEDPQPDWFTFFEKRKELTNRRSKLDPEVVAAESQASAANTPQRLEPSLSGLAGGKVAMPVRMEQLASYSTAAEESTPTATKPLYRLNCQIEVQQADGKHVQLSAPQIVTPAETSLALGESQFKFRVEPAHDGKIQLTVCDPRGFCHVTPVRDGQSVSFPWANEKGPHSGTICISVARADAALTALLSAANQASEVAKISRAAYEEVEPLASDDGDYEVRVYRIADLIEQTQVSPPLLAKGEQGAASLTDSSNVTARVDDLLEKIHAAAPEGWDGQGGTAHAEYYPAQRALVIRQTSANHNRIEGLLQVLRDADQLARGERAAANAAAASTSLRAQ